MGALAHTHATECRRAIAQWHNARFSRDTPMGCGHAVMYGPATAGAPEGSRQDRRGVEARQAAATTM